MSSVLFTQDNSFEDGKLILILDTSLDLDNESSLKSNEESENDKSFSLRKKHYGESSEFEFMSKIKENGNREQLNRPECKNNIFNNEIYI